MLLFSNKGNFDKFISQCTQVSRSSSVPPNTRDSLYQGLPPTIKSALRSRLQSFQMKEEVLFFIILMLEILLTNCSSIILLLGF